MPARAGAGGAERGQIAATSDDDDAPRAGGATAGARFGRRRARGSSEGRAAPQRERQPEVERRQVDGDRVGDGAAGRVQERVGQRRRELARDRDVEGGPERQRGVDDRDGEARGPGQPRARAGPARRPARRTPRRRRPGVRPRGERAAARDEGRRGTVGEPRREQRRLGRDQRREQASTQGVAAGAPPSRRHRSAARLRAGAPGTGGARRIRRRGHGFRGRRRRGRSRRWRRT